MSNGGKSMNPYLERAIRQAELEYLTIDERMIEQALLDLGNLGEVSPTLVALLIAYAGLSAVPIASNPEAFTVRAAGIARGFEGMKTRVLAKQQGKQTIILR